MPNLAAIGQKAAEIWRFFDFSKMAAVRHLGFVMSMFGLGVRLSFNFVNV